MNALYLYLGVTSDFSHVETTNASDRRDLRLLHTGTRESILIKRGKSYRQRPTARYFSSTTRRSLTHWAQYPTTVGSPTSRLITRDPVAEGLATVDARHASFPGAALCVDRGAAVPDQPDHRPAARDDREPLPFRPLAAGCAFSVHIHAGQWGTCGGRPTMTGVWTSPLDRERWRAYACSAHADRFDGPRGRPSGRSTRPQRRSWRTGARRADALAGRGWRPPRPMEPRRSGGRLCRRRPWRICPCPSCPATTATQSGLARSAAPRRARRLGDGARPHRGRRAHLILLRGDSNTWSPDP